MSDTISRRMAIDSWDKLSKRGRTEFDQVLMTLPSADRPKGKWIPYLPEGLRYKCSECESKYDTPWHFCPNCGSYNGGESDDKG